MKGEVHSEVWIEIRPDAGRQLRPDNNNGEGSWQRGNHDVVSLVTSGFLSKYKAVK